MLRVTESNWNKEPFQRDEDRLMMTVEVALMHLPTDAIAAVVDLPVYVTGELDDHLYEVTSTAREIFKLAPFGRPAGGPP